MKKKFAFLCLVLCSCLFSTNVYATDININGVPVAFTTETGSPIIDSNNRTLVPLRVTMEAAGAYVEWNPTTQIAKVVTSHRDITVPIGESYISVNGKKIEIDSPAVIVEGRTYLPIRAVLEGAGFNVSWDDNTKTVFASNYDYTSNDWVPYSTSSYEDLITNIAKGNVVYYNGQYWASPQYTSLINNEVIVYYNDISAGQENTWNADQIETSLPVWTSDVTNFRKVLFPVDYFYNGSTFGDIVDINKLEDCEIFGYVYVYGFYDDSFEDPYLFYGVDEMTEAFMNAENATGTFNGIRMKKENGILYFNLEDLQDRDLI